MTTSPPPCRPKTGLAIRASLPAPLLPALLLPALLLPALLLAACGGAEGGREASASTGSAARAVEDVDAARAEAARPLPVAPPERPTQEQAAGTKG
jgi:hypothetical protein